MLLVGLNFVLFWVVCPPKSRPNISACSAGPAVVGRQDFYAKKRVRFLSSLLPYWTIVGDRSGMWVYTVATISPVINNVLNYSAWSFRVQIDHMIMQFIFHSFPSSYVAMNDLLGKSEIRNVFCYITYFIRRCSMVH